MKEIIIENIRNIELMKFRIPAPGVHIITGKNGSGKTTLFTCINRIGNKNAYKLGFQSSNDSSMDVFSGSITYEIDGNKVKYTKRSNGEWRPHKRNSSVFQEFSYPQIINITTKDQRIFTQEKILSRRRGTEDVWINEKMNLVFGVDKFSSMIKIPAGEMRGRKGVNQRRNIAYAIPLSDGKFYTEQNFSFGEIIMINLFHDIKNAVNGSLILIDELEMALHPSAQIRLIVALKELAKDKGLTILISTHSSSIIRAEKNVIFLEQDDLGNINVIYQCPPAKAIGAIGMREDTSPDIIVLVEDSMAKSFFNALKQKYFSLQEESNYLDIRILEIGGYENVIHFFIEANNYIFYDNVYVSSFMDKDVETDIIPYPQYGNSAMIRKYEENMAYLHFLPYTPEVLLIKVFYLHKTDFLRTLVSIYDNQQLQYSLQETFNFEEYEADLPQFLNQTEYNSYISSRGAFRKKCKDESERIAKILSEQINQSVEEIYRIAFKYAVDHIIQNEMDVRGLLASTMKRIRR